MLYREMMTSSVKPCGSFSKQCTLKSTLELMKSNEVKR